MDTDNTVSHTTPGQLGLPISLINYRGYFTSALRESAVYETRGDTRTHTHTHTHKAIGCNFIQKGVGEEEENRLETNVQI